MKTLSVFQSIERELALVDDHFLNRTETDVRMVMMAARTMIRSGGKRVRPALVLLAAQVFGPIPADAIRLASAVEMVHVASLLHDDVVDNALSRRGTNAVSVDLGNKVSILLADVLLTQALLELCKSDSSAYTRIISAATSDMALGQLKEIEEQNNFDITVDSYLKIIHGKTAALMGAASKMGAMLGGASPAEVERLANYGVSLGLGFQIVDDLLDLWGDEAQLGKPVGNDLLEKKFTLPVIHALRHGSPEDVGTLKQHLTQRRPIDGRLQEIRAIMDRTGAREACIARARAYAQSARENLDGLPEGPARSALSELVDYVVERNF